jgi:hypothetical protein
MDALASGTVCGELSIGVRLRSRTREARQISIVRGLILPNVGKEIAHRRSIEILNA